jgi:dipeptidyl aminopeptidase/acylaminoacyl peptidase
MKTQIFPQRIRARFGAKLLVSGLLLVLAGCVTQRIVWSPDGKQAAVLTSEGLYLCDADGKISGLLLPDVSTVSWFKDSRRLAIARSQSCTNWHCVAAALNPQSQQDIRRGAAELLAKLQKGNRDQVLEAESRSEEKQFFARLLYLRDEGGDAALKLLEGAKELKDLKVDVSTLAVAQVSNGVLDVGPVLAAEIGGVVDIRISPNGAAVAYTAENGLSVVALGGGEPARLVAGMAAAYPDWSPDGNSLVYITTATTNSTDDIKLGVLTRRRVLNERGQVEIQNAKDDLAGLLFNDQARVRCLRDGRILFASEEWRLPVTTNDLPQRQQLFALDPERQSTLTPLVPRGTQEMLPAGLSYFEVSPDEKRVAVGGDKSRVAVFTLASGNVELLQDATDTDLKSIPCWRSASELCFIAIQSANTNQHKAEVALWQNGKTRFISRTWPEPARKGLLE